MIGGSASFTLHLRDRHLAFFAKQFRQMALVTRIEVLNQHECHAGIVRQMVEQCVNASRPPAEAPTPTMAESVTFNARRLGGHCGNGVRLAASVLSAEAVPRFGRRDEGARLERATSPSGPLPAFFPTRHHYLSHWNERAILARTAARSTLHP